MGFLSQCRAGVVFMQLVGTSIPNPMRGKEVCEAVYAAQTIDTLLAACDIVSIRQRLTRKL